MSLTAPAPPATDFLADLDDGVAELTTSKVIEVLAVASEIAPLAGTGERAGAVGALPRALQAEGVSVRTLVPGTPGVLDALTGAETVATLPDLFGGPARILAGAAAGLDLLVVDAPHLYAGPGHPARETDESGRDDDGLRYGALGLVAARIGLGLLSDYRPAIVHGHDWPAGLAAAFLHVAPGAKPKTVMTIHDLASPGQVSPETAEQLGLPPEVLGTDGADRHGMPSFLKAGLVYADRVTTVSPTYAVEIMTPENGLGFDDLLRGRAVSLTGIRNGIDDIVWDPAQDPDIAARYAIGDMAGRALNKEALQRRFGLDAAPDALLFGMVGPLSTQKGLDLVLGALPTLLAVGGQLAIVGTGDAEIEDALRAAAERHPGRVGVVIGGDEPLAHLMQSGADAILMPSRVEPCGRTQLCALRYGAVPVVARVGGLTDTVVDANEMALAAGCATGIMVSPVTLAALDVAIRRTAEIYRDPEDWAGMVVAGMATDVSWRRPARKLAALYRDLLTPPTADAGTPL